MQTTATDHNPYLAARHVHNERYLSLAKSIRNWQLVAGGLLLANVGLAGGLVCVTNQQQIAPYIVEVDAAGTAAAIRELRAEAVHDPLILSALLKHWLTQIRTISTDEELTRRQMNAAYHMCLSSAQNYLTAYYTETTLASLHQRGRTFPINVSLTPLSPQSWRARWKEQTLSDDGAIRSEQAWEATIEITLVLPQSKEERQFSPLGVWVTHAVGRSLTPEDTMRSHALLVVSLSLLFTSCAAPRQHPSTPPLAEATRVQDPVPTPLIPPGDGQLFTTESPEVQAAFTRYVQTGKAPLIDHKAAGFVQYPYGLSQPTVFCRPLELCDIELAPGEEILDLAAGDQERWVFQPLRSGPADRRIVHVMAKPTDVTRDMQTAIVIGTTHRTYRIRLLSRRQGTIVNARFYYPQDMVQHFNVQQAQQQHAADTVVATLPAVPLESLDDRYTIEGAQAWRPTWVANDGTHTYLKMPATLRTTDAPALFVQTPSGEQAITNFRVKGGYYVIDALFDRAVLSWGVGSNTQTVTISRIP